MSLFEIIAPALGQALRSRGYETLTPVQEAVLAPELAGADLLVSAQTGSGKTVAFGLALAPMLLGDDDHFATGNANRGPAALAVAPTRELALQVRRELEWLYAATGTTVVSCVGGMDMRTERRALERGAHIVVGTPGRLRDHIERHSLDMSALKAVVLDEADEMLDLGFRDDLEFILKASPADRRTLMFSATVPRAITSLAKRYQRDAARISTTAEREQHADIEYQALSVAPRDQENAIINVLRYFDARTALVFCGTRAAVNRMTSRFNNRGFSVVALSGELSQNERTHALQALRDGRARVCIATDVAARGIDVADLDLVIHADLPKNRESLLHRSGRTGRAGRKGTSVLIVPHRQQRSTERLLRDANVAASWAHPPSVEDIMRRDDERLLTDPVFGEPTSYAEKTLASELLERHGAERVAAAFVSHYRAGQSAPEELLEVPLPGTGGGGAGTGGGDIDFDKKRDDAFKDAVWISLSVGHDQNAEARWILPMLCRGCDVTKYEVGRIRIQDRETYVELAAPALDRFLAAVGPAMTLEKTIAVARLDAPPAALGTRGPGPRVGKGGPRRRAKPATAATDATDATPRPPKRPHRKGARPPAEASPAAAAPSRAPRDAHAPPADTRSANGESGESRSESGKPGDAKQRDGGTGPDKRAGRADSNPKGGRSKKRKAHRGQDPSAKKPKRKHSKRPKGGKAHRKGASPVSDGNSPLKRKRGV